MDGASFRSLIEGSEEPIHDSLFFEIGATRAILKGDWKYLAFRVPEHLQDMSPEERAQTFRRARDPQAPFSHMIDIPGGRGTEQRPIRHYRHYHDPDQLYNLKLDPGEQNNLADDPNYAAKLSELKAELTQYLKQVPGPFGEFVGSS